MSRRSVPLADDRYDVVILGGGLAGAAAARDLALRGVSVALLDRSDFGAAATSTASRVIAGGLAALERCSPGDQRASLRERRCLQRLAPHLVRPVASITPLYRGVGGGLLRTRLRQRLHGWLAATTGDERGRVLRAVDALSLEPALRPDDLRGAACSVDALVVSPERLCLEHVLSAARHGARVFNYCEVEAIARDRHGVVSGVRARDLLTDRVATLQARIVVNAAGPWVDDVRAAAGVRERGPLLRRRKTIHCVLPRLTECVVHRAAPGAPALSIVPWREFSLIGTEGADLAGDPARVQVTSEEVEQLLGATQRVLADSRLRPDDVLYAYAGVRSGPLDERAGRRPERGVVAEEGGRLLSLAGANLVGVRRQAEALGDLVLATLGRMTASATAHRLLDGTDEEAAPAEAPAPLDVAAAVAASGLPRDTVESLVATYGRSYRRVVELAGKVSGGTDRLCSDNPEIVVQLYHAVAEEHTITLQDFLLRRTGLGTSRCRGMDCAEAIAARLATLLGWSARRRTAELDAYAAHVERGERFRRRA